MVAALIRRFNEARSIGLFRTKMDKLVLGNVVIALQGTVAIDLNPPGKAA